MRKRSLLAMSLAIMLLLSACGGNKPSEDNVGGSNNSEVSSAQPPAIPSAQESKTYDKEELIELASKITTDNAEFSKSCGVDTTLLIKDNILVFRGTGEIDTFVESDYADLRDLNFKYIVYEDGVTNTGEGLLIHEEYVDTIVLSDTVTTISKNSFAVHIIIKYIEIPSSVKTIEQGAFMETEIEKIIFNEGLETIGDYAFLATTIYDGVKNDRYESRELVLPTTVQTIGKQAFSKCSYISKVVLPDSLTELGEEAFKYCGQLREVVMNDNIINIRRATFYGCDLLEKVTLSSNLESIETSVFDDCISLKEINLPSSVKSVGNGAFCENPNLLRIYINSDTLEYSSAWLISDGDVVANPDIIYNK